MKIGKEIKVLGLFLTKKGIKIFRVAIFPIIWNIENQMGTLIKKVTPDSSYLWLKTSKNEICFSGFPKKAYQGSLISEGAVENLIKIIFSLTPYSYYSAHANAVSGNSMCYIQMGCER